MIVVEYNILTHCHRNVNVIVLDLVQDTIARFMSWLDSTFPEDPFVTGSQGLPLDNLPSFVPFALRHYAMPGCLEKEEPTWLRPWHLPWHKQCGLKGVVESETLLRF